MSKTYQFNIQLVRREEGEEGMVEMSQVLDTWECDNLEDALEDLKEMVDVTSWEDLF